MKVKPSAGTASFEPNSLRSRGKVQPRSLVPIPCRICDMESGHGRLDFLDGQILSQAEQPLNPIAGALVD